MVSVAANNNSYGLADMIDDMIDQPRDTFFPAPLEIMKYSHKVPSLNQHGNPDRDTTLVYTDPQLKS